MFIRSKVFMLTATALALALGFAVTRANSQATSPSPAKAWPVCLIGELMYSEGAQVKLKGGTVRCRSGL